MPLSPASSTSIFNGLAVRSDFVESAGQNFGPFLFDGRRGPTPVANHFHIAKLFLRPQAGVLGIALTIVNQFPVRRLPMPLVLVRGLPPRQVEARIQRSKSGRYPSRLLTVLDWLREVP